AGVWCALALANLGAEPQEVLPVLLIGRDQLDERHHSRRRGYDEGSEDAAILGRLDATLARGLWPRGARAVPRLLAGLTDSRCPAAGLARALLADPETPPELADALLGGLLRVLSADDPRQRAAGASLLGEAGSRLRDRTAVVKALP